MICIQSVSDIITNSSSEVFLCDYNIDKYLEGTDTNCYKIDEEFLCSHWDRDLIYGWLEIPDILDGITIDFDHLGRLVESDYDEYRCSDWRYSDLLELFREYVKENQEAFDRVLGHYLVFVSDHDHENYEHNLNMCDGYPCLGHY